METLTLVYVVSAVLAIPLLGTERVLRRHFLLVSDILLGLLVTFLPVINTFVVVWCIISICTLAVDFQAVRRALDRVVWRRGT